MKTGIDLILAERWEQIRKHGRTIERDAIENEDGQLKYGAQALIAEIEEDFPSDWEKGLWDRLMAKPEIERLTIAGALIAAEIDRLLAKG